MVSAQISGSLVLLALLPYLVLSSFWFDLNGWFSLLNGFPIIVGF
jgi:hypothetical protein